MSTKKDYCFVIMPFNKEMQDVYEDVIKPSIEESGIRCIRADEMVGAANIVRKIIEYIYDAKVVVADLTGKNANVFYELGIAHCFGNNTIVLSQEEVPFDVKNYKVIMYENTISGGKKLHKELVQNIKTIEEWSAGPTNPVQDFLPAEAKKVVPSAEFEALKSEFDKNRTQLTEAQKKLEELEDDKSMIDSLKAKSEELEHLREMLKLLFPPELLRGKADLAEVVEEIINQVEKDGTVSVDVNSQQPGTTTKKLTFKKVN